MLLCNLLPVVILFVSTEISYFFVVLRGRYIADYRDLKKKGGLLSNNVEKTILMK